MTYLIFYTTVMCCHLYLVNDTKMGIGMITQPISPTTIQLIGRYYIEHTMIVQYCTPGCEPTSTVVYVVEDEINPSRSANFSVICSIL